MVLPVYILKLLKLYPLNMYNFECQYLNKVILKNKAC